jgi:hypothetical protein
MFNFEAQSTRLPPDEGEELSIWQIEDIIAPWPSLHGPTPRTVSPTDDQIS